MPIRDLTTHPAHYVTIAELAEYWGISRQQIYKRIGSGALAAIQLGSRLIRIRTSAALEYERRASVNTAERMNEERPSSVINEQSKAKRAFKKSDVGRFTRL